MRMKKRAIGIATVQFIIFLLFFFLLSCTKSVDLVQTKQLNITEEIFTNTTFTYMTAQRNTGFPKVLC